MRTSRKVTGRRFRARVRARAHTRTRTHPHTVSMLRDVRWSGRCSMRSRKSTVGLTTHHRGGRVVVISWQRPKETP
jgi:hypothetical protein